MSTHDHPHGKCECDGPCMCSAATVIVPLTSGPAAYRVKRDGRTIHICTKCLQVDDTAVTPVATLAELPTYIAYDPLGGRVLNRKLQRAATLN